MESDDDAIVILETQMQPVMQQPLIVQPAMQTNYNVAQVQFVIKK
jgi:hypothetical protein